MHSHSQEHQRTASARQSIQPIGEVGGVAFGQKYEQSQGPDQRTDRQIPTEGQGDRVVDPALQCCHGKEKNAHQALQQQLAAGCEASVGLACEAAPIIEPTDHHVSQGDAGNSQQLLCRCAFGTDQPTNDRAHRHHQQPPHRGGPRLGLMGLGPFLPDHLSHLQGFQPGDAGRGNQG